MRLAHHAIALFLLLSSAVAARANTYIWSGGGADNKWSTPANWQGNAAPNVADVSPDTLVFFAGAAQTFMHNDLPAGSAIAVLQFHGSWEVTGNQIRVTDRIEQFDTGTGYTRLYCPIGLANAGGLSGTVTFKVQHLLVLNGVVSGAVFTGLRKEGVGTLTLANANTYGGHTTVAEGTLQLSTSEQGLGLTTAGTTILDGARLRLLTTPNFDIDEPITIAGDGASLYPGALVADSPGTVLRALSIGDTDATIILTPDGDLRVFNPVTGAAGLVKRGAGTLTFAGVGSNTYTGVTINREGLLQLSKAVAVPAGLIVEEGTVRLHAMNAIVGGVRIDAAGTLDLNGYSDAVSALEGTGTVTLGDASLLVVSAPGEHSTFGGSITGTGKITKAGPARLTLSGTSTNAGGLTIADGTVRVTGSVTGPVTVTNIGTNTGTLLGEGTIGELAGDAGIIYVGPGALRTRAVTLSNSIQLLLSITNAMPRPDEALLAVTGSVTLNDTAFGIFTPADFLPSNRRLVLIDNDGTDPVNGTFQGVPEGGIFKFGGHPFRITYAGSTGNDVVATAIVTEHHLSEGATGQFFDTDLLIANPNGTHAPIEVRYLKPGGAIVTQSLTVPALARTTIRVDDIATLENTEVSFIVRSLDDLPLVVERTMRWDAAGYGAHTEKAVGGPSRTWYFAEGAQGFFSTYLLLANPHAVANTATVEYLRENGLPLVRSYPLASVRTRHRGYERRSGTPQPVLRHDRDLHVHRRGGTVDVLRPGPALERGTRVGWRPHAVHVVVPRRRRDRPVLRNVRPPRQSAATPPRRRR